MLVRTFAAAVCAAFVALAPALAAADETPAPPSPPSPLERLLVAAEKTCVSVMPDAELACVVAALARRCEDGDAGSCAIAARVNLSYKVHDVAAGAVATALLARACTLDPETCVDAARAVVLGWADHDLARRFLVFGCLRSAGVCRASASMYAEGKWMPRDVETSHWFAAMSVRTAS